MKQKEEHQRAEVDVEKLAEKEYPDNFEDGHNLSLADGPPGRHMGVDRGSWRTGHALMAVRGLYANVFGLGEVPLLET